MRRYPTGSSGRKAEFHGRIALGFRGDSVVVGRAVEGSEARPSTFALQNSNPFVEFCFFEERSTRCYSLSKSPRFFLLECFFRPLSFQPSSGRESLFFFFLHSGQRVGSSKPLASKRCLSSAENTNSLSHCTQVMILFCIASILGFFRFCRTVPPGGLILREHLTLEKIL